MQQQAGAAYDCPQSRKTICVRPVQQSVQVGVELEEAHPIHAHARKALPVREVQAAFQGQVRAESAPVGTHREKTIRVSPVWQTIQPAEQMADPHVGAQRQQDARVYVLQ